MDSSLLARCGDVLSSSRTSFSSQQPQPRVEDGVERSGEDDEREPKRDDGCHRREEVEHAARGVEGPSGVAALIMTAQFAP